MLTAALLSLVAQAGQGLPPKDTVAPKDLAPIAPGPFRATLDSLRGNRYPAWFTRGKLGIWAHWGPQSVPMEGDWYARKMYEEGSGDYKDNLTKRGHPSVHGYKDIIPMWRAEKWDPDRLIGLYKKAGARYFVSMGVHHDNFDLWDSTYHRWNAVKMGPKRDVVGTWQRAAKKQGLRFGVSEHLGASFTWFQASRGADKTGAMAGVPYDGANPAYDDLYHVATRPGDRGWYSTDERWHAEWYRRVKDLVDKYHPDLLYSDGGIPFGHIGEAAVANLYNLSVADHGRQEAVYTCKQPSDGRWAQDVERGVLAGIQTYPWQTDTSIGDWFYNRHWTYRGADWVIKTLVDVVSKNGNLLINVVQRPDGSLDPEAEQVLADMASWMSVNRDSIFETTPWIVFGEGPMRAKGGAFKEDFGFTASDVRFTQRGTGTVYATLMGKPNPGEIVLKSLRREGATGEIRDVSILGLKDKVEWTWLPDGLHVRIPAANLSNISTVIRVKGKNLRGFTPPTPEAAPSAIVEAAADGSYALNAEAAEVHGDSLATEVRDGQSNLGFWDSASDFPSWTVNVKEAGVYEVVVTTATQNPATRLSVECDGQMATIPVASTGDWGKFTDLPAVRIRIGQTGRRVIRVKPASAETWHPINLRRLVLRRVG